MTDTNPYADDPRLHAPSGADGRSEKSVAPGPGASSPGDVASEEQAAREAGGQAAGVAGVDAERAAPIPKDDVDALAQPGTASAEPGAVTPDE
ncbi:MAG TPA: hypothetical protein VEZ46_03300 [Mycobacteriales bacterium]|jgi:hypothetical protein|nr:hypothetical protein [Mycobacteriales bacterium]